MANVKGVGSRSVEWKGERKIKGKNVFGYNSHDHLGTISLVPLPSPTICRRTPQKVLANNRLTETISALAPPRKDATPRPVPERHGEPSPIKHVLYIIKENRTYDQVFGDIERGEGDPSLCIFGREVTPNHHKLVDEFVLLDNFYCSGVLSADGHQWTDEAYVTDYIEKAFGGWPRSYPYAGGDAMAYARSGFLWDNALAHKKTLRDLRRVRQRHDPLEGSRTQGTARASSTATSDFLDGTGNDRNPRRRPRSRSLEPYVCPTAIGFPSIVPDVYRADQFIRELKKFEAEGELPNLMIMLLPNDHTSGTRPGMPTPEAVGGRQRPGAGPDRRGRQPQQVLAGDVHLRRRGRSAGRLRPHRRPSHRGAGRSAPTRRRDAVDSTNYNQTSMVRTIELILGLPPMNQLDASATPMASCFTDKPNLAPYDAVKNNIPLDRLNPELAGDSRSAATALGRGVARAAAGRRRRSRRRHAQPHPLARHARPRRHLSRLGRRRRRRRGRRTRRGRETKWKERDVAFRVTAVASAVESCKMGWPESRADIRPRGCYLGR